MAQDEDIRTIIIDSGGDTIKAGFAKDQFPHFTVPCTVGRRKGKRIIVGMGGVDAYVGDEARKRYQTLTLKNPIQHGVITNWDDMEKVWHHTFYNELRIPPEEHPILLTEMPLNPKCNRERTTQMMFETFNTPALYHSATALLSLYGAGRTAGVVVESGHTVSHTVPIFTCSALSHAIQRLDLAGSNLTDYIAKKLTERSYSLNSTTHTDNARYIKEKLAFVPVQYQCTTSQVTETAAAVRQYQLPDGQAIIVERELLQCPEALFQPSILPELPTPSPDGVHQYVNSSILKCDKDIQKHLYANIVLSGGSTLFPGVRERIENEISSLAPNTVSVRVIAPAERRLLPWIGGSNLASLSCFNRMWLSKQEYDESGPSIIRRRIF